MRPERDVCFRRLGWRGEALDFPWMSWLDRLPWTLLVALCLTLGLAPFTPPHLLEKGQMLAQGQLVRPLDGFDLFLHGAPWLLLLLKGGRVVTRERSRDE